MTKISIRVIIETLNTARHPAARQRPLQMQELSAEKFHAALPERYARHIISAP